MNGAGALTAARGPADRVTVLIGPQAFGLVWKPETMTVRRSNSTRKLTTPALAAIILAASAACGSGSGTRQLDHNGVPVGPISLHWTQAQPLAHLYYPSAKPFYLLGAGSDEKPGSAPAYAGAILTSGATGARIYQWYFRELSRLGWHFVTDNGCSSVQLDCPQFDHTGHGIRESFVIAVDSPAELPFVIGRMPPHACTVYEMSYQVFPPGGTQVRRAGMSFSGGHQCWWTGTGWRSRPDMYP